MNVLFVAAFVAIGQLSLDAPPPPVEGVSDNAYASVGEVSLPPTPVQQVNTDPFQSSMPVVSANCATPKIVTPVQASCAAPVQHSTYACENCTTLVRTARRVKTKRVKVQYEVPVTMVVTERVRVPRETVETTRTKTYRRVSH